MGSATSKGKVKFEVEKEDLDVLLEYSKELGARESLVVDLDKHVKFRESVRRKCEIPNCGAYAVCFQCPPSTPGKKRMEACIPPSYDYGILAVIYSSPEEVGVDESGDIIKALDNEGAWSARVNRLAGSIESKALELGYYKAMGFTCGPCTLCGMITGQWFLNYLSGEEARFCELMLGMTCRLHRRARPSAEPCGIDIIEFIRDAGLAPNELIMPEIMPDCVPECPYYGFVLVG